MTARAVSVAHCAVLSYQDKDDAHTDRNDQILSLLVIVTRTKSSAICRALVQSCALKQGRAALYD